MDIYTYGQTIIGPLKIERELGCLAFFYLSLSLCLPFSLVLFDTIFMGLSHKSVWLGAVNK